MGDSYISGEGVPPFLLNTDVDGANECHRSTQGYPLLLDYDPAANLNLVAFPACSGATTLNVTGSGQWGESRQLDAIPSDAQLVVLSIGGNDIDFAGGAETCAQSNEEQDCVDKLDTVLANADSAWFAARIADVLTQIDTKAPNAQIVLVGYPEFLRKADGTYCDWRWLRGVTANEAVLIHEIATTLNDVLETQAAAAASTFFFPVDDVYNGHAICEGTPYVNGVDLSNKEYSYHPNAAGVHAVYEELLDLVS